MLSPFILTVAMVFTVHLVLTMQPHKFAVLSAAHPFIALAHPGAAAVHANPATTAARDDTNRAFLEARRVYTIFHSTEKALKTQLISACPNIFLQELFDDDVSYGNVTTLDIRTHLWLNHGAVTQTALDDNLERMKKPWHPTTPIQVLFDQLQSTEKFAIAAGVGFGETNMVHTGYNAIKQTNLFDTACEQLTNHSHAVMVPLPWDRLYHHMTSVGTATD